MFKGFEERTVVRISDKTQNYSKVTKLQVKPLDIIINLVNIYVYVEWVPIL